MYCILCLSLLLRSLTTQVHYAGHSIINFFWLTLQTSRTGWANRQTEKNSNLPWLRIFQKNAFWYSTHYNKLCFVEITDSRSHCSTRFVPDIFQSPEQANRKNCAFANLPWLRIFQKMHKRAWRVLIFSHYNRLCFVELQTDSLSYCNVHQPALFWYPIPDIFPESCVLPYGIMSAQPTWEIVTCSLTWHFLKLDGTQ